MKKFRFLLFFPCFFLFLSSCTQLEVYEKNSSIPQMQWKDNFQPSFDFTVSDTTSRYNLFIVLRHTESYNYNNIWLNVGMQTPADSTMRFQRIELPLGNDAKGWEGTGMDDIWEVRKPITSSPVKLKKPGTYKFSVAQIMRENPLKSILSVGFRVEKVK